MTCYDESVGQFVTCCHQCAGMRLCRHYNIRAVRGRDACCRNRGGGGAYLCPIRIDWQSPDRESQILMVLSLLPLAICFPSGLHATQKTLKLREVITRINRSREGNTWKKTYARECPNSVDWQSSDRESQTLMVLSQLPLAICFPSGLHATE